MEKWTFYALVSMLFAGITSVIAKFGMKNMSSDAALAVRTTVVFSIVSVQALWLQRALPQIRQAPAADLGLLFLSGLSTSLSWIFYYRAMQEGPVSYVASIDKGSILVTLLLSFLLLKEPMSGRLLLGAALILAGLLLLVWK